MKKISRGNRQWWQVAIGVDPLLVPVLAGVTGRAVYALQRERGLSVGPAPGASFAWARF